MTTPIISVSEICPNVYEMVLDAPEIARKAKPGQFSIAMADEYGERIPLTLADWDAGKGTVTLVIMALGTSTQKLCSLKAGQELFAFAAPLGQASEIKDFGEVIMVAGGVGAAPIYPIAKELKRRHQKVITIHAARSASLLFWGDKLREISDEYHVTTDDGSVGIKGLCTAPLTEILSKNKNIGCVYAIGPARMMHACSNSTKDFGIHTIVSLNTIMIDGTGMCGGCRVSVSGKPKFACVDGPEFDAHLLDWASVLNRQKGFHKEEACSLERYVSTQQNL